MKKRNRLLVPSLFLLGLSSFSGKIPVRYQEEAGTTHQVKISDRVEVSDRTLTNSKGSSQTVSGTIYYPDGSSYRGKSFVVESLGVYRVEWKALIDGEEVKEEEKYVAEAHGYDLFTSSSTTKRSYGSYSLDESYKGAAFTLYNGSSLIFNRTFDITRFDKNTPFIDFMIDPFTYAVCDFKQLTVRVAEAKNPDNYFEIVLFDGKSVNNDRIYAEARFHGGPLVGYTHEARNGIWFNGIQRNNGLGAGLNSSFCGSKGSGQIQTLSCQLYYNAEDVGAYLSPAANGLEGSIPIMSFIDTDVFKDEIWNGFEDKEVTVTLTPSSFASAQGRIIIKSIGGYDLSEDVVSDQVKPVLKVNTADYQNADGSLPKAKVGCPYHLFPVEVSDNFDLDLKAHASVSYVDPTNGKIDLPIQDDAFEVTRKGTYEVMYTASDYSGNAADPVVYNIVTDDALSPIALTGVEEETNQEFYTTYLVPEAKDIKATGGSGKVKVTRTIKDPQGNLLTLERNQLLLDQVGTYHILYSASDILNDTASLDVKIHVSPLSKPKILGEPNLPKAFIQGMHYDLKPIQGVETKDGKAKLLSAQPKINGQEVTSFTPSQEENVTLTYQISGETGTSEAKEVKIPVLNTEQGKNQALYLYGDLDVREETNYLRINCTESNQSSTFLTVADMQNLSLRFIKDARRSKFSSLYVKFTDSEDLNNTLTVDLSISEASPKMTFPTRLGEDSVDFSVSSTTLEFNLNYNDTTHSLSDISGKETALASNDQKDPFKGFAHGAYVTIGFRNRTGNSTVSLVALNSQSFGYDPYNMGVTYENSAPDSYRPTIRLKGALETEQKYGENLVYPDFEAYDVLSDIQSVNLKVTSPSGKTKLEVSSGSKETFKLDEYGSYTLLYTARDGRGNTQPLRRTVFVFDEKAPELKVDPLKKTEYSVGEHISIPSYQVSDDSGHYSVDVMVLYPDNNLRMLTHDEDGVKKIAFSNEKVYEKGFYIDDNTFAVNEKGTYKLRFVAYDEDYNRSIVELTFTVK